jgi:hypothetical protein
MELACNGAPGYAKLLRDCDERKALALQALQPFDAIKGPWATGCARSDSRQPLPDLADPLVCDAELGGDRSGGKPGAQSFEDGAVAVTVLAGSRWVRLDLGHARPRNTVSAHLRVADQPVAGPRRAGARGSLIARESLC